jgi:hypothetical protein
MLRAVAPFNRTDGASKGHLRLSAVFQLAWPSVRRNMSIVERIQIHKCPAGRSGFFTPLF